MFLIFISGMALLAFVVLPELDVVKGAMLTNCLAFIPSVFGMLFLKISLRDYLYKIWVIENKAVLTIAQKSSQFLFNLTNIQPKLPTHTHRMIIFTKFGVIHIW